MPVHDWTKAPGGYFHHFGQQWTVGICNTLNGGIGKSISVGPG